MTHKKPLYNVSDGNRFGLSLDCSVFMFNYVLLYPHNLWEYIFLFNIHLGHKQMIMENLSHIIRMALLRLRIYTPHKKH